MYLYNIIDRKIFRPLQTLPMQWYYSAKKKYDLLDRGERLHHIVVSLTSFPARFATLHFAIKSILNQKLKPDVVFLCLTKEEVESEADLPPSVLDLKKFGLHVFLASDNLKPHNKYLYAMQTYSDSLVITVDDDNMYDRNLVCDLYASYLKHPRVVSARRVHKITKDKDGNLFPYKKWHHECRDTTAPSHELLATGVGGVLYPPSILPPESFDATNIRELCLNADDIWLKFMELKNNVPVVWVKNNRVHPLAIKNTQMVTLQKDNNRGNHNDKYINKMQEHYKTNIVSYLGS